MKPVTRTLLVALCLIAVACGDSPTGPSGPANVAGNWSGQAVSNFGSHIRFNLTVAMTQSGSIVGGSMSCSPTTPLHPCPFPVTTLTGAIDGNTLTAQTTFAGVTICGSFMATVTGSSMAGTWGCAYGDSGTWSMTKQ
jgi:hypothetical protein